MKRNALALAALVALAPLTATAGTSAAWTAAKANLPKETTVLVGLDLTTLTKASLFTLAFPMLLAQQPELKEGLELVKSTCKLDPMKVITSVVAGTDDTQKHGALFLSVDGVDAPKLQTCLESIAKAKGKEAKFSTTGKLTEVAVGDKKLYLSWVSATVLAVPLDVSAKADLEKWGASKGGLGKSKVAKASGKVNTGAALWAVSAVAKELDNNMKMKLGYGAVTMSGGNVGADLHVQLGSAADAKAAAEKAQKELTTLASGAGLDPKLKTILSAVTVTAAADEMQVKGSIPENEIMTLVGALMSN